jgi:hypothetical protein
MMNHPDSKNTSRRHKKSRVKNEPDPWLIIAQSPRESIYEKRRHFRSSGNFCDDGPDISVQVSF